jgi:hypothetical protein
MSCPVVCDDLLDNKNATVFAISSPVVIAPISVPPPSSEISVTLTIDSSTISNLPSDEESPRVPHENFEFPCPAECIVGVNSLSAVDAESKVEEEIPALIFPVDEYTKEEATLSPMHASRSAEYFSPFSIIPTVQVFQDLFRSCINSSWAEIPLWY